LPDRLLNIKARKKAKGPGGRRGGGRKAAQAFAQSANAPFRRACAPEFRAAPPGPFAFLRALIFYPNKNVNLLI